MKIHWGAGLVVAFVLFAVLIIAMVVISMRQNIDLVSEDYYDRELRHEEQVQKSRRTSALGDSLKVETSQQSVTVRFPGEYARMHPEGMVTFYRPSDKTKDFSRPLELDSTGTLHVSLAGMDPGIWKLKLEWTWSGTEYYREETVVIQ